MGIVKQWPLIAATVIVAVLAFGLKQNQQVVQRVVPMPHFSVLSDKGVPVSDHDLAVLSQDKPVLVHFWATWCGICQGEMKTLTQYQAAHPNQSWVYIAYNDQLDGANQVHQGLLDSVVGRWVDVSGQAGMHWGLKGVPETFVVYQNQIHGRFTGPVEARDIDALLATVKGSAA